MAADSETGPGPPHCAITVPRSARETEAGHGRRLRDGPGAAPLRNHSKARAWHETQRPDSWLQTQRRARGRPTVQSQCRARHKRQRPDMAADSETGPGPPHCAITVPRSARETEAGQLAADSETWGLGPPRCGPAWYLCSPAHEGWSPHQAPSGTGGRPRGAGHPGPQAGAALRSEGGRTWSSHRLPQISRKTAFS